MPSEPQKRKSLGLELPNTAASVEAPSGIAALFAIRFDIRTGYVIAWKRSTSDVEVEGVVEYKSLPSGLHNVTEDLVYFVHEQYAGLSAFVNLPAEEAERNAKMFAVGVLVPLSFGRLGKSWRHASKLQELVQQYAQDTSNSQILEEYWERYQVRTTDDPDQAPNSPPLESPISVRFKPSERPDAALESSSSLSHRPALTQYHPASSLPHLVDSFGPLIFPLYRAALLRKRILLMVEAPVHISCNYVYDLSLLASLPNSILPLLPADGLPSSRPRPLFNVGIHDIPILAAKPDPNSPDEDTTWIACSTDSVLSMKPDLYDVLVTLPAPYTKDAPEKVYPKLTFLIPSSKPGTPPSQAELKATQRDASRYVRLRRGIRNLENNNNNNNSNNQDTAETTAGQDDVDSTDAESTYSSSPVVEPVSWTRLAYTSFIWWASAGEKREGLSEEEEEQQIEQDSQLMASIETFLPQPQSEDPADPLHQHQQQQQPAEVALVAYFRRLTAQIFIILADAIARHDANGPEPVEDADTGTGTDTPRPYRDDPSPDETQSQSQSQADDDDDQAPLLSQGDADNARKNSAATRTPTSTSTFGETSSDEDVVMITTEDMTEMGLDVWSITDRVFVEELVSLWWGRQARVDSARIRCCGITIL